MNEVEHSVCGGRGALVVAACGVAAGYALERLELTSAEVEGDVEVTTLVPEGLSEADRIQQFDLTRFTGRCPVHIAALVVLGATTGVRRGTFCVLRTRARRKLRAPALDA